MKKIAGGYKQSSKGDMCQPKGQW